MSERLEIKPLSECEPEEIWPTATAPREVYLACIFHGTHRVPIVEVPVIKNFLGINAQVGTTLQPVSEMCSPSCGPIFLAYLRGTGPECHCLDTPGSSTT
ncbi:hypothetical protein [Curtobacterium phage Parvaparticeps]|nr:hypothetical protein [Curtobacterium phage Parvaparticeps]